MGRKSIGTSLAVSSANQSGAIQTIGNLQCLSHSDSVLDRRLPKSFEETLVLLPVQSTANLDNVEMGPSGICITADSPSNQRD